MIYTTLLKDTGGTVIADFTVTGSGKKIYTDGVNVSRYGLDGGLYIVAVGSVSINRQIAISNNTSNYGNVHNLVGTNISPVWTSTDSATDTPVFVSFASPHDSAGVAGPFIRFEIIGNNTLGVGTNNTITTLAYCHYENNL